MPRRRTTLELDEDLLEWHKKTFPDISLWATTNHLLRAYKEVYDAEPPQNYYLLGAKHLRDQIDKDLKSMDEIHE